MNDDLTTSEQLQRELNEEQKHTGCSHKPGIFLGQAFARRHERYECAICHEEFLIYVENK